MTALAAPAEPEISARQAEVLDAVLRQLVTDGNSLTMSAVARRASCSKETLYKWFGDRDGLLNATVKYQAARVHVAAIGPDPLDRAALTARLEGFAINWLTVISSETSLALNRVAIGQAGSDRSLGAIVLANGRFALGSRMKPVLEAGRKAGLLAFEDAEEAFRTLFGLVARDVQIRLLLGDTPGLDSECIRADAIRAVAQFFALYGAQPGGGKAAP
ncbi:MAG: TetR/AcrR family transcriptional regulator C-terminal domain-containing protein [Beijerinckiaceae bacterium]|nr:TetR/AcrR family transcriptional regulator C-terminal domain-containing protein [Beijerinckiaceae bacterium]